jgi:predicted phosphodiesterase
LRYALISDVHANLPALEAALEALAGESVDGYLCAGDLVGYGPHPNECIALLHEIGVVSVAGNHDLMAVGRLPVDRAGRLARATLSWSRERLDARAREFLSELPTFVRVGEVALAHGSLHDAEVYVEDTPAAGDQLAELARAHPDASLLVLGHTHRPAGYAERGGRLGPGRNGTIRIPAGERWLINPGSVGQARERQPLVRFAVIDLERREARFHATRYDVERTRRDLIRAGLPATAAHRPPRLRHAVRRALRKVAKDPRRARRAAR